MVNGPKDRSNATFITLVPKSENSQGLDGFRLILLVACLYKITTKVLFRRLGRVLEKVIDAIGGRNMMDGIVTANEVIVAVRRDKRRGLILKVDYEKAYDSVC